MIHLFIDKKSSETLVLFHGTGANEHDLVPLAEEVAPTYNILSIRGRVNENGMTRFFKRYDTQTFDLESVDAEGNVILKFLKDAGTKYNLGELTLLGYSNGATMISALLLKDITSFKAAVLLQPGLVKDDLTFEHNKNLRVLVSVSNNDPYLPFRKQTKVLNELKAAFKTTTSRHDKGHSIPPQVVADIYKFLN